MLESTDTFLFASATGHSGGSSGGDRGDASPPPLFPKSPHKKGTLFRAYEAKSIEIFDFKITIVLFLDKMFNTVPVQLFSYPLVVIFYGFQIILG